jgi:GT2 family glycosyltransferase
MSPTISVIIPTYQREEVLLDTIRIVLAQQQKPFELLIVDQSPTHTKQTTEQLEQFHREGSIRWIRLEKPSIPKSMNHGLQVAKGDIVLFLDDDITASDSLLGYHANEHKEYSDCVAVVGQVLQPGETPQRITNTVNPSPTGTLRQDHTFRFDSSVSSWTTNVMAGNLSVNRRFAIRIGGFDENFLGAAYRFESEFARRIIRNGGHIRFCADASINHLRVSRGGTRAQGTHQTSASPLHGVGDYYYALNSDAPWIDKVKYISARPFREVITRFHLAHPWYIPVKLVGEIRALALSLSLTRCGPKYINETSLSEK